jgi:hypothetical protein
VRSTSTCGSRTERLKGPLPRNFESGVTTLCGVKRTVNFVEIAQIVDNSRS